jgi:hypothetical protein
MLRNGFVLLCGGADLLDEPKVRVSNIRLEETKSQRVKVAFMNE